MRKHDVRKWLHAVLDLLPVILIPVFMIYSHRHTIDSGSIDVPQNQVVDFNQLIEYGDFSNNSTGYWRVTTGDLDIVDNEAIITNVSDEVDKVEIYCRDISTYANHIYYGSLSFDTNYSLSFWVAGIGNSSGASYTQNVSSGKYTFLATQNIDNVDTFFDVYYFLDVNQHLSSTYVISNFNFMLIDLTQMFGSGNEPTLSQFNQWYTSDYYEYTLSHKELLKGYSTITFNDTDIMSQVVYQLYNSVDKYFNMGNVFNMTGVYDWFNLNIFNGNAPISIYIVWNIVLYEFVMDLLFLLYGLFMWFIDMVEKLMEKPLKSVK